MGNVSHYTDIQRAQAAAQYSISGNQSRVSEVTGIPRPTIGYWVAKDASFQALVSDCQQQQSTAIKAGLAHMVERALTNMHDRLENGDEVWINAGKELGMVKERKAISFKDLAIGAAIGVDKLVIIRKTEQGGSDEGEDKIQRKLDRLLQLASVAELDSKPVVVDNSVDK